MLPDQPVPDVSLASCDKLEEVHTLLRSRKRLPRSLTNLLSSITSQKLRKVSLSFMDIINSEDLDSEDEDEDDSDGWNDETETWGTIDTILGRLAGEVSKAGGKLILQLNIQRVGSEPIKFDHLLNRFLDYGEIDVNPTQIFLRCRMKVGLQSPFRSPSNSGT